jgi:hypothetical protein
MRLGPYEITLPLGAGGMGEVYRAHDATLSRGVAIKVLPEALASDAERLARFKREAQPLASLNHPKIAQVYGFEGATLEDGSSAHLLAMELVEGEDLAQRLGRGAIPADEAIAIAKQIAEAHDSPPAGDTCSSRTGARPRRPMASFRMTPSSSGRGTNETWSWLIPDRSRRWSFGSASRPATGRSSASSGPPIASAS